MANKYDYLTEYRQFFEKFADTVEPNDQLPVKLGSYKFVNTEVVGGIIDWCLQYLSRKSCPSSLVAPLIKTTIDEIRQACKKHPVAYGFNPSDNVYEPLKLMQVVMQKINEVCLRYLDNSRLDTLPPPSATPLPKVSVCASRNTRRRMEDRHVVIHDLNTMFNVEDSSSSNYYAIFDGHAGSDAAAYSAAHLHQFIAESQYYPTDPERALKEAFLKTDEFFIEKSKVENFHSGTTAVCALLRPKQQTLYVAWVGDSQALLVNRGKVLQIVKPHKPSRNDEKNRIEANGGCVVYWGMWRVNGQLAVSRAIGDLQLKPYVIADPDVAAVPLDGNEEFLIIACDGLWDFVTEDDAALEVYNRVRLQPDNIGDVGEHLVSLAKKQGSKDNISVIVVFIKEPSEIASSGTDWGWAQAAAPTNTDFDIDMDNSNFSDMYHKENINGREGDELFATSENPFKQEDNLFSQDTNLFQNPDNLFSQDTNLFQKPDNLFTQDTNLKSENVFADTNLFTQDSNHFQDNLFNQEANHIKDTNLLGNLKPDNLFFGLNGKRVVREDEEFDEDDDMGPETDVDGQDDGLMLSPALAGVKEIAEGGNNNEGKGDESDSPPADSVLDSSGIADNVADSGDDSEDEWNYYCVDPKKENATPIETQLEVSTDQAQVNPLEDMSQLNPNAAEFVPVSPTLSSPTYGPGRDLLDDKLLAQSPRRAVTMDIDVPSEIDFDTEIKNRPSEVDECEGQNGHQMSSQELMQNFLNGKDINEIEFHPTNFVKTADNEIFPSKEDLNISGVTQAATSPIDTENKCDQTDFIPIVPNEQDPMNMSFYEDKDENCEYNVNPFDLNKVQRIPDEEFADNEENNEEKEVQDEKVVEDDQPISPVEIPKSPTLDVPSPSVETTSPGPLSPKSPLLELTGLVSPDVTASIKDENVESKSPAFSQHSTATPVDNILKSPEIQHEVVEIHHQPEVENATNTIADFLSTNLIENVSKNENIVEEMKQEAENCENEIKEQVISLENVVKEVERDTANFIEDACKYTSENVHNLMDNIELVPDTFPNEFSNIENITNTTIEQLSSQIDVLTENLDRVNVINDNELSDKVYDDLEDVHSEIQAIKCTFDFAEETQPKDEMKLIEENISHMVEDARQEAELIAKSPEFYPEDNQAVNLIGNEEIRVQDISEALNKITDAVLNMDILKLDELKDVVPVLVETKFEEPALENNIEHVDVKRDTITPEYAVPTLTSPEEKHKELETPPATPVVAQNEVETKSPEPQQIVEAVEKLTEGISVKLEEAAVIAATAVAATAAIAAKTPTAKPKTTTVAKKPSATKISPTSPTKLASKTTTSAKKTTSTTTYAGSLKPRVTSAPTKPIATKTVPSPKSASAKATMKPLTKTLASKPLDRKPLTNGVAEKKPLPNEDVKPKPPPIRRPTNGTTATVTAKPSAEKLSQPKPPVTKTASPRPAPGLVKAAPKPTSTTTIAAPKPRPISSTLKSTTTTVTKTLSAKLPPSNTARTTTVTAAPKPRTTTTIAPKPKSNLLAKPKTAEAEKLSKETANKQLSAARTGATRTTTLNKTTTLKKLEPKVPSARTTTRTTTTTLKSTTVGKKPSEVSKTTITKTKEVTAKVPPKENGIIQEITTTVVTDEPQLIKDNSPLETVDNSLIDIAE